MNRRMRLVVDSHRRGGVRGVLRDVRGRLRPEKPYQRKVEVGREARWAMYDAAIPADAANLLDVGCNLGQHTAYFASRGIVSLGVDVSAPLVQEATRLHTGIHGCAFMLLDITEQAVMRMPSYDVVMVLSVHHHWVNAYDFDGAGAILAALFKRTNKVLIFEGASRRIRYGQHAPRFVDNDEASVTAHLESFLQQHLGGSATRIVPLGAAAAVGEREPLRWSWAVYR